MSVFPRSEELISGPILRTAGRWFDRLDEIWSGRDARRVLASTLVVAFLVSICVIEMARLGWLPTLFGHPLPTNHFQAISWVVTLLLIVEVLDLIFGLAESVARMIGKQLEIFSLVLLRKTFDVLPSFPEPIQVSGHLDALGKMGAEALGALSVFALLAIYYRIQRHEPVSTDEADVARFVRTKKLICLLLLAAFVVIGAIAGVRALTVAEAEGTLSLHFFELFFTILIFADVMIVLASLGATRGYRVVFRNFAFAFVTVSLRLALAAEPFWNALIGVTAAAFALAVSWVYRLSSPSRGG